MTRAPEADAASLNDAAPCAFLRIIVLLSSSAPPSARGPRVFALAPARRHKEPGL